MYPNCHIAYLFEHRPGLFNNEVRRGFINATNNFDFELHTIKPEQCLKLMAIYGYNLSQEGL
jgi:hypothetical protein